MEQITYINDTNTSGSSGVQDSNIILVSDIDLTNPEVRGIIGDTIFQSKEAVGEALTLIDNTKEEEFSRSLKEIVANTQQILDKGIQYFESLEDESRQQQDQKRKEFLISHGEIQSTSYNEEIQQEQIVFSSNTYNGRNNGGGLISMLKGFLIDVKEEVLGLDNDDYDELADALLMTSRISLMMAQGTLTKIEKVVLPGGAESTAEIEDATQEEIDAYKAGKTANAIPRSVRKKPNVIPKHRMQQGRLIWHPLFPQATYFVTEGIPNSFQQKPFQTGLVGVAVLPFSGLIIFFTPGVLLGDAILQEVYKKYGSQLEIFVADSSQFLKLGYISCKLTTKQSYRMIKKQFKKMKADPKEAVKTIGTNTLHVITHPVETTSKVISFGKTVFNRFHTIYKFVQSTR